MAISRIFDISRRTLATYQRALDITAHNIANSSNPYYSRQTSLLTTENPEQRGGFIWGTGVRLDAVLRVRDDLTDAQLRVNYHKSSDSNKRSVLLGQIETLFSEPSELGLSNLINTFFNSFNELAVNPSSTSLRQNVIQAAEKMSSKVKSIYDGLDIIKSDVFNDALSKVEELNYNLEQIQRLNKQIYEASTVKQEANDLMDQRDRLIDEVSKTVNLTITKDDSGSVTLSIGGVTAVDLSSSTKFKLDVIDDKLALVTEEGEVKAALNGGELNALSEVYSKKIPEYNEKLEVVFKVLTDSVNSEHSAGYSISNPPKTGITFFESFNDGLIKINQEILSDPSMIAVSSDGSSGNGDIAIKIAGLMDKKLISGSSFSESYTSLVSLLGNDKLSSDLSTESSEMVIQQLELQKASYSGVSIDEEMTNMIKYQRSYDAAAKLIKVADEMLETLLNMV